MMRAVAPRRRVALALGVAAGAVMCAAPAISRAQGARCDSVWSRTALASLSGRPVRSVRIETQDPASLKFVPSAFDRLHVRTRDATVRRLVLVAAGDTVDTLRVSESLRRLRQLRYLGDVAVLGTSCDGGPVDVSVVTRDLWSVRPSLQLRTASQAFSVTERNVFGTGREASIGLRSDANGVAVSAGLRDPWFLGRDLSLDLTSTGDGERGIHTAVVRKREHSILDRSGLEGYVEGSSFGPSNLDTTALAGAPVEALRRIDAGALVSRRVHLSSTGVLHATTGAEFSRLEWELPAAGRVQRLRQFTGLSAGLRRRSVAYDTVTWFLPERGLVDVPTSYEYDVLASAGTDNVTRRGMLHLDAWVGRMWFAGHERLLVGDLWGSGYVSGGTWSDATVRASLSLYARARGGLWTARVSGERWFSPDPDVRSVTIPDPTIRALEHDPRAAPDAALVSVERSVHLRKLTRSYTLDVAGFGAASARTAASVGTFGVGLRLAPTRLGRATARLDVGWPVVRRGEANAKPFMAIGITQWLEQDRSRDGRRSR
ncbi:MAG TPA: hypothetical protein VE967_09880 [Gemmatimonadaceae bacterium]|nr:hypothetical protein [Gemmatimonadaceae bacterium]